MSDHTLPLSPHASVEADACLPVDLENAGLAQQADTLELKRSDHRNPERRPDTGLQTLVNHINQDQPSYARSQMPPAVKSDHARGLPGW